MFAITLIQRDAGGIRLRNPSFEASGLAAAPGYITGSIAGWDAGGGGRGVNVSGIGPFADNGSNPDQDSVLFLQDAGARVEQLVSGLTSGQNYTVRFGANARNGNQPMLKVSLDEYVAPIIVVTPVGNSVEAAGNARYFRLSKQAPRESEVEERDSVPGDHYRGAGWL